MKQQNHKMERELRASRRHRRNRIIYIVSSSVIILLLVLLLYWIIKSLHEGTTTQLIEDLGIRVEEQGGDINELSVDSALGTQFTAYKDGIALLTGNEFRVYSSGGNQDYYSQLSYSVPILKTGGDVNLIFDRGGTNFFIVNNLKETLNKTTSMPIINGEVNGTGWVSLIAQERGYKNIITVYDKNQKEYYFAYFSSSYALCSSVSEDGKYLAAGSIYEDKGAYGSKICFYDMNEPEAVSIVELEDSTVLDVKFLKNNHLAVVTDNEINLYEIKDNKLNLLKEVDYQGEYLRSYSLGGDNYVAAIISKYKIGGQGRLLVIDGSNNEPEPIPIDHQIISMSASGTYISILTANEVQVYNRGLSLLKSDKELLDVRKVLVRNDSSVLEISTNSVRVFK